MCSRFRSVKDIETLIARYGVAPRPNFQYNPNVAPTDETPIIRSSKSEGVKLEIARFGLVPSWAKKANVGSRYINARSETVAELSVYAAAYHERRCVIPVLGFYEWKINSEGKKIPFEVHRKDNGVLSLAGIWEYTELENEKIYSFSIITGPPSKLTEPLHHRTPIILQDPMGWIEEGGKEYFQRPDDTKLAISERNPVLNNSKVKDPAIVDSPIVSPLPVQANLI